MAKQRGIKWIIGLSSVVLFTGFIGLAEKYDQANATNSTNTSGTTNKSSQNSRDSSTPFFSEDHNDDSNDGTSSFRGSPDGGNDNGSNFQSPADNGDFRDNGDGDSQVNGHSS